MKRKPRIVPEIQVRTKTPRAGFVTGYDSEVEVWQVWMRRSTDGEERRATTQDIRRTIRQTRKVKP